MVLLFSVPMAAQAALTLKFEINKQTIDSKLKNVNGKQVKTPQTSSEKYTETVSLGDRLVTVTVGQEILIYDFVNRRIVHLDSGKKTRYQRSLYSVIGFRRMEFGNRQFLGNVLSQSGVKDNPMGRTPTEHLFSIYDKRKPLTLPPEKDGKWIRYGSAKLPLLRVLPGKKISQEDARTFIAYLRYRLGGHPLILDDLEKGRRLPAQLEFHRYNLNQEVYTYRLVELKQGAAPSPTASGFREVTGEGKLRDIEKLIARLRSEKPDLRKHAESLLVAAEKDYKQQRYLDSMLSYIEYTLETGEAMPQSYQPKKQQITADKYVKQMLQNLSPKNKQEAEAAVKVLAELKKHSQERKHVLGIFEGNIYGNLGNSDKPEALLMQALRKNPLIIGVYKDLGDIYHNSYHADLAWLCWDFARDLVPDHRLLTGITAYEKKLELNFPGFFL